MLKPLLFNNNDQSEEAIFLRSRIGAFEIQIFSKNRKGDTLNEVIFSKLTTRIWPSIPRILENITDYLPRDDFVVRLIDPSFNPQTYHQEESKDSKEKPSKLKGIEVVLRPLRLSKTQGSRSNNFLPDCKIFRNLF